MGNYHYVTWIQIESDLAELLHIKSYSGLPFYRVIPRVFFPILLLFQKMFPRGLIIAVVIGIIAGAIVGVLLVTQKNGEQLEFVLGPSISIVTDKTDFEQGEQISIKIINSGTSPLTFSDASYGLKITGLDGRVLFSPVSAQVISTLEPTEEISFVWDQIKNDGDQTAAGTYKIISNALDGEKKIKKSITINIYK